MMTKLVSKKVERLYILYLLIVSCSLGACVHQPINISKKIPIQLFEDGGLFGQQPDIIQGQDIFLLTEQQKQDFYKYFNDRKHGKTAPHQRLIEYFEHLTHYFNYRGETLTASQALSTGEGNCLSLAILTTAFAKLGSVEVGYQLIDSSPVFQNVGNTIEKGIHVRSKLYPVHSIDSKLGLLGGGIMVDYFPTEVDTKRFLGNLSEKEFIASYYQNIASDYLQLGDYNNSYWYALKSFEYAPDSVNGANLMAVIFKRVGQTEKAERIYQYAINSDIKHLSLLKNYRQLLKEQNRLEEVEEITQRIARFDDPSPYSWLQLADTAYNDKELNEAKRYYKKAIEMAPYLQYGYLGLAKVYYLQGNYKSSKIMLENARDNNYSAINESIYDAKLLALQKQSPN